MIALKILWNKLGESSIKFSKIVFENFEHSHKNLQRSSGLIEIQSSEICKFIMNVNPKFCIVQNDGNW